MAPCVFTKTEEIHLSYAFSGPGRLDPQGYGRVCALPACEAFVEAPAGALAVTAWEGALHWVLPKAEGLEVAEASGEGGDGG